tara:strand:- start:1420 stop:1644 length:225 start_codon:yes stop_codon:yes gene_type:complete
MEMENQTEPLKVEFIDISDIGSECESGSLNSWYSESSSELDKIHRFKEKKIIYELYREGKFDYNQLKEMLELIR